MHLFKSLGSNIKKAISNIMVLLEAYSLIRVLIIIILVLISISMQWIKF